MDQKFESQNICAHLKIPEGVIIARYQRKAEQKTIILIFFSSDQGIIKRRDFLMRLFLCFIYKDT